MKTILNSPMLSPGEVLRRVHTGDLQDMEHPLENRLVVPLAVLGLLRLVPSDCPLTPLLEGVTMQET